jgi:hypothetical protein
MQNINEKMALANLSFHSKGGISSKIPRPFLIPMKMVKNII